MTDTPDTLTSKTPPQAGVAPEAEPELVAFADCEFIGINSEMMLVINRQNGNQQLLSPQVVEGLKTCTGFKTIAAHAAHLASTRAELQGQEAMAANALTNLKDAGMLLLAGDVCARLAQPIARQLPATRAFVITCDRPAAVNRLLDSMLGAGKLGQHNALFLIDDSREPENRHANREAVERFNLHSAKEMFYVGAEAQQALLSGLIEALPEHEEGIRFLLDLSRWEGRKTYGRSRTLSLLLSVGYRALVMDDDILCQAVLSPVTQAGVGIGSGAVREAAFFGSEEELLNRGHSAGFDPLSGHASLLGSTLATALQTLNSGPLREAQLLDCNGAMANVLTADAPVLVTQCGSLGDPGTGSAHWPLSLDKESLERLVAAPQGITGALESRLSWLGSTRPNINKMSFMSQLTGLDNSQLLPPYFPAFRCEDALFGAMVVAMHPLGVALEYPWSVPHLRLEPASYSASDSIVSSGGLLLFVRYLTEDIDYRDAVGPEHTLGTLAQDVLRMSARSDEQLLLDYRIALSNSHAHSLHLLQTRLVAAEGLGSTELQDYLRRGIGELQQAIATVQSPAGSASIPEELTEQEILDQFRQMARGFSAGLAGWAEVREVAASLADQLINAGELRPR